MEHALQLLTAAITAGEPDAVIEPVPPYEMRVTFADGTRVIVSVSVYE